MDVKNVWCGFFTRNEQQSVDGKRKTLEFNFVYHFNFLKPTDNTGIYCC